MVFLVRDPELSIMPQDAVMNVGLWHMCMLNGINSFRNYIRDCLIATYYHF